MNCATADGLLAAYLDGELTPETKGQVQAHLSTCERCQKEIEALAATQYELRQALKSTADSVSPPSQAWDELEQLVAGGQRPSFTRAWALWLMERPWRIIVTILLIIAIVLGILWGLDVLSARSNPTGQGQPVSSGASWAKSFEDMTELCAASDVIALGMVDRVIRVTRAQPSGHLYFTDWAFRIEKVLKGRVTEEVTVHQTGAAGLGSEIAEDPLFRRGERYVLFLKRGAQEIFYNLGPWGRYKVVDGRVYSVNRALEYRTWYFEEKLDFNGVAQDDFIADVTEVAESPRLTFMDRTRLPVDVFRTWIGGTITSDVAFWTGKYGPGKVSYTVKRVDNKNGDNPVPLPEGIRFTITPAKFTTADPGLTYESRVLIWVSPDTPGGTYWVSVDYEFEGAGSGHRIITLHVDS